MRPLSQRTIVWCVVWSLHGTLGTLTAAQPADLVLLDTTVATMDPATPTAEAVACRDGRIIAAGSNDRISKYIGPSTQVLRLKGQFVMPGFIEGHGHFYGLGKSKLELNLAEADRWEDVVEMVEQAAKTTPPGQWIVGRGWHQSKWSRRPVPHVEGYPVHEALSRAAPRHFVYLTHASGHMAIVNRLALEANSISKDSPDPSGGEILRLPSGEPTGVLRETAQSLVRIDSSPAEFQRVVHEATRECLRQGVTSFQDAGSSLRTIDRYRELADDGLLPVRLWVMIAESNRVLRSSLPRYRMIGAGDQHLTVRAIKCSIDGALGTHGAWLLEPYEDNPQSKGLRTLPLESLRATAALAVEHDFQLCVHAIGDRANREVLDIFQAAFEQHPADSARRWRVEHAQHLNPRDIPRFAELDVIASMQGIHCTSDAPFVIKRLGIRRTREGAYVWQSLLRSGALVINGTDAPVESVRPLASIHASVTRRLTDDSTFFPDQCMTRPQALRSYTIDAAYAAFEEEIKGSITPGKLADLVVLSKNLLACDDDEILDARVLLTIVGGKVLFTAAENE
jgi:hypothetical protein